MDAMYLYKRLDDDFELESITDEWSMLPKNEYISDQFLERYMGIMLDNSHIINHVYSATFPDEIVLKELLEKRVSNALLVSHHAMIWDPRLDGFPFRPIPDKYYLELKKRKISFYVLYHPLDKNGKYSTARTLANALKLELFGEFCEYMGVKVGIIGRTNNKTIDSLKQALQETVGHKVKVWNYGDQEISDQKVCVVGGGGNMPFIIKEVVRLGVNVYITGVTKPVKEFSPSIEFHELAKKYKINIIAATHYPTEKFACMALVEYFRQLGVPCEFIEGKFYIEDYE
ncbi:MAG: Nif3-like dinuclear metal center hexameric protein [Candidatus Heimdallarchaeota archaeon]